MEFLDLSLIYTVANRCTSEDDIYDFWYSSALPDDLTMIYHQEGTVDDVLINRIMENELVCSYFPHGNLIVTNNKIVNELRNTGRSELLIDHTLTFDTNICTYINALVHNENDKIPLAVQQLLKDIIKAKLNYDFTFYLYENSKYITYPINSISEYDFWNSINNVYFKENLISLIRFK